MNGELCKLEYLEATVLTSVDCFILEHGRPVGFIGLPGVGTIGMGYVTSYYCSGCETRFEAEIAGDPIAIAIAWQEALAHLDAQQESAA